MVLSRARLLLIACAAALVLLGAVLFLRAPQPAQAATGTVRVSIADFAYSKATVRIKVGQRVRWTNRDAMMHTVTSSKSGGPRSGDLDQGESYTWRATKAGTFSYFCKPHPWMKAKVIVTK